MGCYFQFIQVKMPPSQAGLKNNSANNYKSKNM